MPLYADITGMSDGPYRSLPMSKAWRKAARIAENDAASDEEVSVAVVAALASEWDNSGCDKVLDCVSGFVKGPQKELFSCEVILQGSSAFQNGSCAQLLVDNLLMHSQNEGLTSIGIDASVADTVDIQKQRFSRQVHEHYLRKTDTNVAKKVSHRILSSVDGEDRSKLIHAIINKEDVRHLVHSIKKTGLDEGIPFSDKGNHK